MLPYAQISQSFYGPIVHIALRGCIFIANAFNSPSHGEMQRQPSGLGFTNSDTGLSGSLAGACPCNKKGDIVASKTLFVY